MLTLSKNRVVVPVLLQQSFIKLRQEHLQLFRMVDGSFLVAFECDAGSNPELLLGCIGQWLNTDDYEYAADIFAGLEMQQAANFIRPVQSVTQCNKWKDSVFQQIS